MSDTNPRVAILPPAEVAERVENAAATKAGMPTGRILALSIPAGIFVGLGASFMLTVRSDSSLTFALSQVLGGLAFCLGLFLVLVAGAELFTGNSLMIQGVLSGRIPVKRLARNWALVYLGNAIGSVILVALLYLAGFLDANGGAVGEMALTVATSKAGLAPVTAFVRGILCNVLVCLAVWMGFAGNTVCDKLAVTILPVVAFVVLGFEHSVANMFFLPLGLVAQATGVAGAGGITLAGVATNLLFVTAGNVVGGGALGAVYWLALVKRRDRS